MFSQVMTDRVARLPRALLAATCLAGALGVTPAAAQDTLGTRSFHGLSPVADEELADLRGGFAIHGALLYFSIDLYAEIDGTPVYDIGLQWDGTDFTSDPGNTDPDNFVSVGDAGAIISAINSGPGNLLDEDALASTLGVVNVVQNSLDNVTIQQLTEITMGLDASGMTDPGQFSDLVQELQNLTMF